MRSLLLTVSSSVLEGSLSSAVPEEDPASEAAAESAVRQRTAANAFILPLPCRLTLGSLVDTYDMSID